MSKIPKGADRSNGYTKLPHGFHKRLWELKGARLAVWLAHRSMEGKAGTSYPSLQTLAECTGYDPTVIKLARKWLREKQWLVSTGQNHTAKGKFSVPVERTAIPRTVVAKHHHGTVVVKHTVDAFSDDGKHHSEVDTRSLEADTGNLQPLEVGVSAAARTGQNASKPPNLPGWVPVPAWNAFIESRKRRPNQTAQTALLKILERLHTNGEDILERLEFATANGTALQPSPRRPSDRLNPTTQDHVERIKRNARILGIEPKNTS